jgi:arginase family enzyme
MKSIATAVLLLAIPAYAAAQPAASNPRVARPMQASTMYGVPSADLNSFKADVVFLGVPYDLGHASLPGTRLGPAAIREASSIAGPAGADGFYDRETGGTFLKGVRLVDAGDVITPTANVTQSLANVTSAIAMIVKGGAMPVTIGGDHSITFAVLRGFEGAGRKIHIIHFDSHQDFGPLNDRGTGQPVIQHGNHLHHAVDLPWIGGLSMIGLRGLAHGAGATASEVRSSNVTMISASQALKLGPAAVAAQIPAAERITSRSTSTCSIHQSRPRPVRLCRAASPITSCAICWKPWPRRAALSASTLLKCLLPTIATTKRRCSRRTSGCDSWDRSSNIA